MSPVGVEFTRARTKDANAYAAPILGAGTLQILDEGVRFRARRTRSTFATLVGVTVGLFGVLVAAFVLAEAGAEPRKKLALLVGLACGVLPGIGVYALLHAHLRGPFADVLVPWSALRVLDADAAGYTLRLVAPDLRGDVIAVPSDAASAEVLSALKHR
ncbi:MAG: hypothetical protein EOO73_28280 [Myxococcales bacterium]|nr:MAG: hypothetical protein EOO73_28280 [Myxococcales bacterium]